MRPEVSAIDEASANISPVDLSMLPFRIGGTGPFQYRWPFLTDTLQPQGPVFTWQEAVGEAPISLIRYASFKDEGGGYSLGEKTSADKQAADTKTLSLDVRQHVDLCRSVRY